jgi:hypothetical protein
MKNVMINHRWAETVQVFKHTGSNVQERMKKDEQANLTGWPNFKEMIQLPSAYYWWSELEN